MGTYTPNPNNDPQVLTDLDDSVDWTSAQVNSGPHSNADSVAYLRQRLNADDGANWPAGVIPWSDARVLGGSKTYAQVPPVWDAGLARWIGAFSDGTNPYIAWSADGVTWVEQAKYTAAGSQIVGLGTNSAGGHLVLRIQTGGTATDAWDPVANAYTSYVPGVQALAPWAAPSAGTWVTALWYFSIWVGWGSGGGVVNSTPFTPTKPVFGGPPGGGGIWSPPTTWAPPSGFVIHNLAHIFAPAPNQICIFPAGAAGSATVSAFMFGINGTDYTPQAMPTLVTGESVIDACWDSFTGTLYLLTGTSSSSRVWSYQGTGIPVFTLVAGSTLSHPSYALRCNGRELLRWMQYGTSFNGTSYVPVYRGVRSVDGAKTWQVTPLATTAAPGNGFALRANGQQFLYVNQSEFAASKMVGALPNVVL